SLIGPANDALIDTLNGGDGTDGCQGPPPDGDIHTSCEGNVAPPPPPPPVVACTITGAGDIVGTEGNDVICGSAGPDRIAGLGGNDVIYGMGGNDQVSAGSGDDTVYGGDGGDELAGGAGNDRLFGNGGGVDRLSGGPGDDTLNIVDGSGGDFAVGGDHIGGDTCVIDPGDFTVQCE
ncbi:MAG: hypothetical protein Q8K72_11720, partial [Acidimicrobiales bacterium]|nr:hypothetical protein [Acidimicrobiales bacterium]